MFGRLGGGVQKRVAGTISVFIKLEWLSISGALGLDDNTFKGEQERKIIRLQPAPQSILWHTCPFPKNQMQNTGSETHQKIPKTGTIIKL